MGDIDFLCPECHGLLVVDEAGAGRRVRCTLCNKNIRVPEKKTGSMGPGVVKVSCPECNQHLEVPQDLFGTVVDCPSCGVPLQLPMGAGVAVLARNVAQGADAGGRVEKPMPSAPSGRERPPEAPPPLPGEVRPTVFPVDAAKPLARVMDERVTVYGLPHLQAKAVGHLRAGDFIVLLKTWNQAGPWLEVRWSGAKRGYLPGSTKVTVLQRIQVKAKGLDLRAEDGKALAKLDKGALLWAQANTAGARMTWVWLDSGTRGVIPADTKYSPLAVPAAEVVRSAGRDIGAGLFWCVGGLIVTAVTYSRASEQGGTYLICWGPVLFGGIQVLKGLIAGCSGTTPPDYSAQK